MSKKMMILNQIKEQFNFINDPIPSGWRQNARNLWISKQKLIDKGIISTRLYGKLAYKSGSFVEYQLGSKKENDIIVDGIKQEVKQITVTNKEKHRINQIRPKQNWRDLIVVLIFSNQEKIYKISKDDLISKVENGMGSVVMPGGKTRQHLANVAGSGWQLDLTLDEIEENFELLFH